MSHAAIQTRMAVFFAECQPAKKADPGFNFRQLSRSLRDTVIASCVGPTKSRHLCWICEKVSCLCCVQQQNSATQTQTGKYGCSKVWLARIRRGRCCWHYGISVRRIASSGFTPCIPIKYGRNGSKLLLYGLVYKAHEAIVATKQILQQQQQQDSSTTTSSTPGLTWKWKIGYDKIYCTVRSTFRSWWWQ